ncbi:hypothetical protein [Paenibacillus illinoisensis]|uniref:hypothetical protein n=1 Tax=Paenibacillus illinoisensis TaxID=59845 RepID=UPI00301712C2
MATSAAKKKLLHALRQKGKGAHDPRASRGSWGNVKPVVRIKESKRNEISKEDWS